MPTTNKTLQATDLLLHAGGKHVATGMIESSGAITGTTAGFAALGSPVLLGAMGLTAAVSAGLTEVEYQHEKHALKRFYTEELAAKLNKSTDKVTDKDLQLLAKGD